MDPSNLIFSLLSFILTPHVTSNLLSEHLDLPNNNPTTHCQESKTQRIKQQGKIVAAKGEDTIFSLVLIRLFWRDLHSG